MRIIGYDNFITYLMLHAIQDAVLNCLLYMKAKHRHAIMALEASCKPHPHTKESNSFAH